MTLWQDRLKAARKKYELKQEEYQAVCFRNRGPPVRSEPLGDGISIPGCRRRLLPEGSEPESTPEPEAEVEQHGQR